MKNNIKKAPVKFWEDVLYFQHFMVVPLNRRRGVGTSTSLL